MVSTYRFTAIIVFLGICSQSFVVPEAFGSPIVSNLTESLLGETQAFNDHWISQKFTVDNSTYVLDNVTLDITSVGNTGGNFFVEIWNDSSGAPGSSIATLVGNANPSTGNNTYTGIATLLPSQIYHVVAGVTSGAGNYRWGATASTNESGTLNWDIGHDLQARWRSTTNGVSWDGPNNLSQRLSIEANAVPEPSSIILLGLTAAGFCGVRLRRRRKQRAA